MASQHAEFKRITVVHAYHISCAHHIKRRPHVFVCQLWFSHLQKLMCPSPTTGRPAGRAPGWMPIKSLLALALQTPTMNGPLAVFKLPRGPLQAQSKDRTGPIWDGYKTINIYEEGLHGWPWTDIKSHWSYEPRMLHISLSLSLYIYIHINLIMFLT